MKESTYLTALRRDLHRHAESGWTEFYTTGRIVEQLRSLGIPVRWGREIHAAEKMMGLPNAEKMEQCWQRALGELGRRDLLEPMRGGFTGCVAEIRGGMDGGVTAIRVDIDCCDVAEAEDEDHIPTAQGFASIHENCMHACGHDAHAAIGVGVARELWRRKEALKGTVRIIFQPAEEGLRGAASMTGLLEGCERLLSLHVGIRNMEVGSVAAGCRGFLSSTKFDALFHGVSAHAGLCPEQGRNAVAAGAKAVLDLLDIPKRQEKVARVNVGTFHGGSGRNVIPAEARLCIETRGETPQVNKTVEREAAAVCRAAAEEYGCTLELLPMGGADAVECNEGLVLRSAQILEETEGIEKVLAWVEFGGGEDVTTLMRAVQNRGGEATVLLLGMPLTAPHHNSRFDIDERVIDIGVCALVELAMNL